MLLAVKKNASARLFTPLSLSLTQPSSRFRSSRFRWRLLLLLLLLDLHAFTRTLLGWFLAYTLLFRLVKFLG